MNNPRLLHFYSSLSFFAFLKQKHYFVFIFNSPSVQHSKKPLDNYEKVLLFLHTTIIANYRHCTNIQIHRCGRRFEQQTVYAIQKGPKGYMWFLTHDGIDRYNGKEFKPYKTDGWR